ncbi:hypothetical protein [Asticcacaulis benevestitus]|uniref:hypothetical protein n=1 Tax=Asticcacaulis benevestitus TaxID=347481 RepID=UPI001F440B63|nr:hypothetical protein [Asticcacaulis benevestitus]
MFPLTVDTDLSLTAQTLLRRECGAQIQSIRLEAIPDKHEARLWVTLAAAAYGLALHALILGLPAAQFGAVKTVRADVVSLAKAA